MRHPIPLYESVIGLGLLALGLVLLCRRLPPGVVALSVGLGYLIGRSLLDLLRAPIGVPGADPRFVGGLTLTQALSLVLVPLLGIALAFLMQRGRRRAVLA